MLEGIVGLTGSYSSMKNTTQWKKRWCYFGFLPSIFFLWWKGKAPLLSNLCQRLIHWKIASLVLALFPPELHLIVSSGRLIYKHDRLGQELLCLFWFQITYINHFSDYYFQYLKHIFLILYLSQIIIRNVNFVNAHFFPA